MKMPYGKYRGKDMETIPPGYLVWLYEQGLPIGELRRWIENHLFSLRRAALAEEKFKKIKDKI